METIGEMRRGAVQALSAMWRHWEYTNTAVTESKFGVRRQQRILNLLDNKEVGGQLAGKTQLKKMAALSLLRDAVRGRLEDARDHRNTLVFSMHELRDDILAMIHASGDLESWTSEMMALDAWTARGAGLGEGGVDVDSEEELAAEEEVVAAPMPPSKKSKKKDERNVPLSSEGAGVVTGEDHELGGRTRVVTSPSIPRSKGTPPTSQRPPLVGGEMYFEPSPPRDGGGHRGAVHRVSKKEPQVSGGGDVGSSSLPPVHVPALEFRDSDASFRMESEMGGGNTVWEDGAWRTSMKVKVELEEVDKVRLDGRVVCGGGCWMLCVCT